MLQAPLEKSGRIERTERRQDGLYLYSAKGILRLQPTSPGCVRLTYTERNGFSERREPGILEQKLFDTWEYDVRDGKLVLKTGKLQLETDMETGSCRYLDGEGKLLLRERENLPRVLEEFQACKIAGEAEVKTETVRTADGEKTVVREAARVPDRLMYHTRLNLEWQEGEALYGLGQHEEGILNLRGHMLYLHQANRKIAVPLLVSSLGYGILVDTYAPMIFSDTKYGSYLYTEADEEMDYYFLAGGTMDGVIREYRLLTGKASLLPKWAFGYIQSQERYETAEEICRMAEAYRKRGIGLDGIVLDWCSWEDGKWGQKSFDPDRFPDPAEMTRRLRDMGVHFMISIWPNMDASCADHREMQEAGRLLPGNSIYDALSEEGRKLYWKQAEEGLFRYGVDGWWCDSSEPLTPEWNHREKPEPAVMYGEYCKAAADLLPADMGNAYALFHARALYEGQRSSRTPGAAGKRVVNLTRSAWTGQQRYGVILWSGDTAASWETLRKQIAAGLNFCASGLPYWTADIGAFFVKRGGFWYWRGDYDDTTGDAGYRELFVRWYQWGAFLPVFRGHGTDCRRELWAFGEENGDPGNVGNLFYDALLAANRLRYALMPYVYSLAGRTWLEDGSMMRLLAFDFPEDRTALNVDDQYLFGEALMVCPVTEPMYYGAGSVRLDRKCCTRQVYLPEGCGWYDFWTGRYYGGGQWIEAEAPIDRIPLFVREGSILPMAEAADRTVPEEKIFLRVYPGRDGRCRIYRDSGDGYGYEKGEYSCREYFWSEEEHKLTDEDGRECDCEICSLK